MAKSVDTYNPWTLSFVTGVAVPPNPLCVKNEEALAEPTEFESCILVLMLNPFCVPRENNAESRKSF
ncbi:hypothetical protein [Leptospira ellisii]|uniref:hypothetical protein n=1 Tax=Leptospira ellisii TaxID=2023197 RepID=UPI000F62CF57|nr:hypothetical protein [Leptospira ellisii]